MKIGWKADGIAATGRGAGGAGGAGRGVPRRIRPER